jgi:hypothetical protein
MINTVVTRIQMVMMTIEMTMKEMMMVVIMMINMMMMIIMYGDDGGDAVPQ